MPLRGPSDSPVPAEEAGPPRRLLEPPLLHYRRFQISRPQKRAAQATRRQGQGRSCAAASPGCGRSHHPPRGPLSIPETAPRGPPRLIHRRPGARPSLGKGGPGVFGPGLRLSGRHFSPPFTFSQWSNCDRAGPCSCAPCYAPRSMGALTTDGCYT